MGHRVVHRTLMHLIQPASGGLCQFFPIELVAASSKYHVKELSSMYSFIVCVLEEASSNYYRLKKIRLKGSCPYLYWVYVALEYCD